MIISTNKKVTKTYWNFQLIKLEKNGNFWWKSYNQTPSFLENFNFSLTLPLWLLRPAFQCLKTSRQAWVAIPSAPWQWYHKSLILHSIYLGLRFKISLRFTYSLKQFLFCGFNWTLAPSLGLAKIQLFSQIFPALPSWVFR